MFIPTRDSTLRLTAPFVTVTLIGINVLVFMYQIGLPLAAQRNWFFAYGVVPARIFSGEIFPWWTFITALFVHGGLAHLLGNLLYLWIFGDNIEATLGHFKFLVFYLLCGIVASLTQIVIDHTSSAPIVGASGAISGVLGAYLIRYPHAKVKVFFWFILIVRQFWVPAGYLLGFWFLIQLSNGLGALSFKQEGGVAWFAHIGGFLAGIVLLFIMESYERKRLWKNLSWKN